MDDGTFPILLTFFSDLLLLKKMLSFAWMEDKILILLINLHLMNVKK